MMYHSRHILKQSMSLAQNGVRQVAVAAQRVHLVPAANQGFFMINNSSKHTTDK